jgi:hypothetical protein
MASGHSYVVTWPDGRVSEGTADDQLDVWRKRGAHEEPVHVARLDCNCARCRTRLGLAPTVDGDQEA